MASMKTKIHTEDVAVTQSWYQSLFDFHVVEEWDDPGDRGVILEFGSGHREAMLEIFQAEEPFDHSGLSLQFKVDDVHAFARDLPEAVETVGPEDRPWGSTYLLLTDPNGIKVIVYSGGW